MMNFRSQNNNPIIETSKKSSPMIYEVASNGKRLIINEYKNSAEDR